MKITEAQLRQIIREESSQQLSEEDYMLGNAKAVAEKLREALKAISESRVPMSELVDSRNGKQIASLVGQGEVELRRAQRILNNYLAAHYKRQP